MSFDQPLTEAVLSYIEEEEHGDMMSAAEVRSKKQEKGIRVFRG